jgi:hypothetical protein
MKFIIIEDLCSKLICKYFSEILFWTEVFLAVNKSKQQFKNYKQFKAYCF